MGPLSDLQTVVQRFAVGEDLLVLQPSLHKVNGEHTCHPNNARYPSIDDLGNGSEILILKLMLFIKQILSTIKEFLTKLVTCLSVRISCKKM